MAKFTAKQQAFINWYVILLNATEAAARAGYQGNRETLAVIGSENLRKPKIRGEIDRRLAELTMTADEVLKRVSDTAKGNLADYIDDSGNLDIEKLKAEGGHLLKKYKKTKRTIPRKDDEPIEVEHIEVELYPADSAHDKLMRYHGLYDKDNQRINKNIDMSTLSDEQLERLANGDSITDVLRSK